MLELLGGIASGAIPLTHDGLTAAGSGRHVDHLRSILQHHGLLPERDEHLARFEVWLTAKLDAIVSPTVRAPVEQFATWHHLRRLRSESKTGQATDGPKRSAKQEITETIKFLSWLEDNHYRTAAQCTQQDADEYLASGPTTRHLIRTFFIWAKKSKINVAVQIRFRQAKTTPTITQEQRLGWLQELLTGDSESLPYRVAGVLLLLYAQPLTKIAALQTTAVAQIEGETRIALGKEPIPVPEPFASQLNYHRHNRPNQRTAGGSVGTPWLFPSNRAGRHLDPQSIMMRLRGLGISLLGSRNTALQVLVSEIPAPLVAEMLGYSDQLTQKHAAEAGNTWAIYASPVSDRTKANTGSGRIMRANCADDRPTDASDRPDTDLREDRLFELDPPVRPYQVHIDALLSAAAAVGEAHNAVRAAEDQLTHAVLGAQQGGLSWAKIGAALGTSRQAAYQRWAARLREIDNLATSNSDGDNHS